MNSAPKHTSTVRVIDDLVLMCHHVARTKGFWGKKDPVSDGPEKIALMHSELSEALEVMRRSEDWDDELIGDLAEEFADVIIRIFDYCGAAQIDIGTAILAKMTKNLQRPKKHGKAF